jgi:hypothetical protein
MSVLACDRYGCENVMCDRLSYTHGYICDECFEELVASGIIVDIEAFMNTRPNRNSSLPVRELYEQEFPLK